MLAVVVLAVRPEATEHTFESGVITEVTNLFLVSHQLVVVPRILGKIYGCRKVKQPLAKYLILFYYLFKLMLSERRVYALVEACRLIEKGIALAAYIY